ncbi:MAG: alpha/beta hydrolase [Bacteroidota bacterium]|nr:alpha/beta hydrolase [Bacteroidota bacterium]
MKKRSFKIQVSPTAGKVSAIYTDPGDAKCILVLAHGAGAGMDHPFMVKLANSLAENGIATLRFNFPFKENKKGRPDVPAVAQNTIEAAIEKVHQLSPTLPVFAAGKSFGGRMSSQYLSTHPDAAVKGIIFYGFPLHAPGKPSTDRADHLKNIKVPMLFLQGTKDALATWDLIQSVISSLSKAKLVKIEGADHSFKAGKINTTEILTKATNRWVEKLLKKG